jgi:hypothetical protein
VNIEAENPIADCIPSKVRQVMLSSAIHTAERSGTIPLSLSARFGVHQAHPSPKWEDVGSRWVIFMERWILPTLCFLLGWAAEMAMFRWRDRSFWKMTKLGTLTILTLNCEAAMFDDVIQRVPNFKEFLFTRFISHSFAYLIQLALPTLSTHFFLLWAILETVLLMTMRPALFAFSASRIIGGWFTSRSFRDDLLVGLGEWTVLQLGGRLSSVLITGIVNFIFEHVPHLRDKLWSIVNNNY